MPQPPVQHLRKFRFNTPQRIAAFLLLLFLAQCLLVIGATPPTVRDTHFAICGSQLWAAFSKPTVPSAICPELGRGVLAYRAAALPFAVRNWIAGQPANARPENIYLTFRQLDFWIRLPFLFAGLGLGACLWWVTRRLFGDPGGYVALALYCFSPPIVFNSALPNPAILAAYGLFSAIYAAIGVAHALQGPRRKWRKRVLLLAVTLGFTAAASPAAFLLAIAICTGLLLWLAEDKRIHLPLLTLVWTAGALLIFFAACGFQPGAFTSFLASPHAGPLPHGLPDFVIGWITAPTRILLLSALIGYAGLRRARYFGSTTPLWIAALFILLALSHINPSAWLWSIPFLFAFIGGVFADLLESRRRGIFFSLASILLLSQAICTVVDLIRVLPF